MAAALELLAVLVKYPLLYTQIPGRIGPRNCAAANDAIADIPKTHNGDAVASISACLGTLYATYAYQWHT